jgi:hypothetical protein
MVDWGTHIIHFYHHRNQQGSAQEFFSYQIENVFFIRFLSDVTTEISPLGIFFEKEIETRSRF